MNIKRDSATLRVYLQNVKRHVLPSKFGARVFLMSDMAKSNDSERLSLKLSLRRLFLLLKIMVDPVIDKADDKAQNAADKETDGIFHGAVVMDIYHDQLKDAYHRQ